MKPQIADANEKEEWSVIKVNVNGEKSDLCSPPQAGCVPSVYGRIESQLFSKRHSPPSDCPQLLEAWS